MEIRKRLMILLLTLILALAAAPALAAGPIDPADLAAFLDERMRGDLEAYAIPGAAVAVVQDGAVVLAQGYGLAEVEDNIPVDPERSMFRIASLTKLFTWTAVMQLVEEGALDLDADVNGYLTDVTVPATYPEPVTLRALMTHSAGFEDRGTGTLAASAETMAPLATVLASHLPARVRPVGEASAYSNHGAALAGLIVEQASGKPYEQAIQERVLDRLGMAHSTAYQPVPDDLPADLALSYTWIDGSLRPTGFVFDLLRPAGAMSASAADMARFMLAHLGNGHYGDAVILSEASAALMHAQAFTAHPLLPGWALGFQEMDINGRRVLFHDGSLQGYISLLVLSPQDDMGLFVAYSSGGGGRAVDGLLEDFFDRYFPGPDGGDLPAATLPAAAPPLRAAGSYIPAQRPFTTVEKLTHTIPESALTVGEDGTLGFLGRTWVPVDALAQPPVYRDAEGDDLLAFRTDASGRVVGAAIGALAVDRLPWHRRSAVTGIGAAMSVVLLFAAVVGWPILALVARRRRIAGAAVSPALPRTARWVAGVAAALTLADLVALLVVLSTQRLIYGVPPVVGVLSSVTLVIAALAAVVAIFAVLAWLKGFWGLPGRIGYTLVALALVVIVWLMRVYNVLGPHLG